MALGVSVVVVLATLGKRPKQGESAQAQAQHSGYKYCQSIAGIVLGWSWVGRWVGRGAKRCEDACENKVKVRVPLFVPSESVRCTALRGLAPADGDGRTAQSVFPLPLDGGQSRAGHRVPGLEG